MRQALDNFGKLCVPPVTAPDIVGFAKIIVWCDAVIATPDPGGLRPGEYEQIKAEAEALKTQLEG